MRTQVEIDFQFNPNSSISLRETELPSGANVSNGELIFEESNYAFKGFKGFHFGDDDHKWPALADGSYKYYGPEGYRGYISQSLTNENRESDVTILFFVDGQVPDRLFISFDQVCNEYATQLLIKNNQNSNQILVNNTRPICSIALENLDVAPADDLQFSVSILKWNKPFKNVKISQISFSYIGVYTENEIINYECSENLFNKQLQIQVGICEQYADIELYDRTELLHEFAYTEILATERKVTIKAIDDRTGVEHILGTYMVNSWDVQSTESTVRVSCSDNSFVFDNVYIPSVEVKTRNVDEMLRLVFSYIKNATFKYIDSETEEYCKSISTPNSWFYSDTALQTLLKICTLGLLRIYWHVDKFIVARCF